MELKIKIKTLKFLGKDTMFCPKEEINHVLGKRKGAGDHVLSKFLFTMSEECYIVRRVKQRTF